VKQDPNMFFLFDCKSALSRRGCSTYNRDDDVKIISCAGQPRHQTENENKTTD